MASGPSASFTSSSVGFQLASSDLAGVRTLFGLSSLWGVFWPFSEAGEGGGGRRPEGDKKPVGLGTKGEETENPDAAEEGNQIAVSPPDVEEGQA